MKNVQFINSEVKPKYFLRIDDREKSIKVVDECDCIIHGGNLVKYGNRCDRASDDILDYFDFKINSHSEGKITEKQTIDILFEYIRKLKSE